MFILITYYFKQKSDVRRGYRVQDHRSRDDCYTPVFFFFIVIYIFHTFFPLRSLCITMCNILSSIFIYGYYIYRYYIHVLLLSMYNVSVKRLDDDDRVSGRVSYVLHIYIIAINIVVIL